MKRTVTQMEDKLK